MRTHYKPLDQGFVLGQPDWDWLRVANARMYDSFVEVTDEWQAFVGRRVEADLRLWQDLARAKAPEALWSIYGKFWQKAFEDYWNEYLALGQLYAEVVTSRTSAPQQCSKGGFLHAKAA
jgi:hypothetical protein